MPIEVKIIQSEFGYLELLNLILFIATTIVAVFNVFYISKRDKNSDLKNDEIRMETVKSYWHREVFLDKIIMKVMNLETEILDVFVENESYFIRKSKVTEITDSIANTIYTFNTDKLLEKKLITQVENFEDEIRKFSLNKLFDKKDVLDRIVNFQNSVINTLFDFEKNHFSC